ncbi:uncharacterized protein LOC115670065 isoform X2 [Syzygium oleosum]|uniref:uncharacterized protein LOC115670065 isoform X2 n=1 Tax=Syzygium oleosum TaxID=219896 RepID=UPI0024BAD61D|nr:uncharacterized protein LOC115670065 isoform X2 [Syzygium oleosum]
MDKGFKVESTKPLRMHSENLKESQSSEQSTSASDREITGTIGSGENRPKNNDRSRSNSSNLSKGNLKALSPERDLSALSKSKLGSITSLSSSLSNASLDDISQVGAGELIKPEADGIAPSPGHDEYCPLKLRKEKDAVKVSSKAEHDSESSVAASTSPMSDITHESLLHSTSPTQSPPIQVMDRSGGYSPHRIPSSVFERSKPSTPIEWSIASNESLFSLHIGNVSFSRDHVTMPADSLKSEELGRSNEFITISSPPPHEVASLDLIVDMEKNPAANTKNTEFTKDVRKENGNSGFVEKANSPVVTWGSSCLSSESRTSLPSFSFPVLTDVEKSNPARLDARTPRSTVSERACCSCHSCRPCHACCSCHSCRPCHFCNSCDCCCHLGLCC